MSEQSVDARRRSYVTLTVDPADDPDLSFGVDYEIDVRVVGGARLGTLSKLRLADRKDRDGRVVYSLQETPRKPDAG